MIDVWTIKYTWRNALKAARAGDGVLYYRYRRELTALTGRSARDLDMALLPEPAQEPLSRVLLREHLATLRGGASV